MPMDDVSVAAPTWGRDAAEEVVLRNAVGALARHGLPIALSDGGSSPRLVAFFRQLPGVVVAAPDHPGLVGQIRAAVRAASLQGRGFILCTESDKEAFLGERLPSFVHAAPDAGGPGIVLAARSRRSFVTYPPVQQYAETTFNHLAGQTLGLEADFLYGPFLMHRDLAPWVDRVPADLAWGWRPFLFAVAHRLGYPVTAIEADHPCPPAQTSESEADRLHRMRQLSQNLSGLVQGMTLPLGGLLR